MHTPGTSQKDQTEKICKTFQIARLTLNDTKAADFVDLIDSCSKFLCSAAGWNVRCPFVPEGIIMNSAGCFSEDEISK